MKWRPYMDFESKPNDDYEDDEPYSNLTRKSGKGLMKRPMAPYILMAAIVLVLVLLLALIFHKGEDKGQPAESIAKLSSSDLVQLNTRLQDLDNRLTDVEKKISNLSAISGKLSAMEGASASNAKAIEALSSKIANIESRLTKVAVREKPVVQKRSETSTRRVVKRSTKTGAKTEYHVVKKGETLYHIARENGISLQRLMELNHLKAGHLIHPGEKLIIRK